MHLSAWESAEAQVETNTYPALEQDLDVEIAILGGGITGLTAAYLLHRAGKRVALLERDRFGAGETSRTTAHLTQIIDMRLEDLVNDFGDKNARLVLDGGRVAMDMIEGITDTLQIDCDFRRLPGYLHASYSGIEDERPDLRREAELANELGIAAEYVENVPLSIMGKPGVRYPGQAHFQPLAYLHGIAEYLQSAGVPIFEQTEVTDFDDDGFTLRGEKFSVRCGHTLIATHVPLQGRNSMFPALMLQSKLYPYTSYALEAQIAPEGFADALFWDTSDPYYYLRQFEHDGETFAILGGEDHKTGQETNPSQNYERLERLLHSLLPDARVTQRWSGQVIETNDGLPYIGLAGERQFIATGYSGNGMTWGTLAAMMAYDAYMARISPWRDLLDPHRMHLKGGTWEYLKENIDYPYYMAKDWLSPVKESSIKDVARADGEVLKLNGQMVACSRSATGEMQTVSAICTHMGCQVSWNKAERTWDCACHGSRFLPDGSVLGGPAEQPLKQVDVGT